MIALTRTDTSKLGRWWWTVDRWLLLAILLLFTVGIVLAMAASPAVANRIGLDSFYFVRRHVAMMPIALLIMIAISLANPKEIRKIAGIVFLVCMPLMGLVLIAGAEIKGAQRWIAIGGFSLQPSEIIKPAFAVVSGALFATQKQGRGIPGNLIATVLYGIVLSLLLLQPDLGMAFVVSAVWFAQFFVAGLPLMLVGSFAALGFGGLVGSYFLFPHVQSRVDRFLDPSSGDSFQIEKSLEAFTNGGLFGRGPGEGTVKAHLPDAHADFIFSVAGEEFGIIACIAIVGLFAFIVLRGFSRLMQDTNLFVVLASTGLLVQFGLQAVINMASSLHLMPTKGMTLPFLSYGGSSMLGLAFGMGMILALTRRRFGPEEDA
ncbi:MAG: putative peptidoglycan glycosyltransferase FtsW [Alphaproteobacteria bacterium]